MQTNVDRDTSNASGIKRKSGFLLFALGVAFAAAPAIAAQDPGAAVLPQRAHQATQAPATQAPAPQAPAPAGAASALAPVQKTDIKSQAAYERLLNNSGVSVQWLWSAQRGHLSAKDVNDVVRIDGTQANFEGTLKVNGEIVSIDSDRFLFRGTILILDAPDKGRRCERTGDFEFKATGKRKYWRLQQMESCGRLTDYVDIYY
ncbi:hypothetical protein ACFWP0_13110 [Achromobacter sp. NPDC058515]|uniref:hypothetical protein n=1 Tax=Achromobacter sp. NPDC058515 TaxID=3346533 RepID=UPI00366686C6